MEALLTVKDVADLLKVSHGMVYKMADKLNAVRYGQKCIRFNRGDVIAAMQNGLQHTMLAGTL